MINNLIKPQKDINGFLYKKKYYFIIISLFIIQYLFYENNLLNAKTNQRTNHENQNYILNQDIKIFITGSNKISNTLIKNIISRNFDHKIDYSSDYFLNKMLILLYETKLFKNINIEYKNSALYISLEENKIVRKFNIDGDKDIKDKKLKDLIDIKPGQVFEENKLEYILAQIIDFYKEIGYFNTRIEKKIIQIKNSNFLDIDIKIIKGKTPKISKISFIGNKHISSEKLKQESFFRERGFLRFLSKKTQFNQSAIKINSDNIEKFYKKQGFLNAKIINQETVFNTKNNEIELIFEIEEGERFFIKNIEIKTDFNLNQNIKKIIDSSNNKVFNKLKIENDAKIIKKYLAREKINADVFFVYEKLSENINNKIINDTEDVKLIYKIIKAKNTFIDKIYILGNSRTKDSVIRNQITIHEGDFFNADSIETSYRRIYNLGFFENINIDYALSKENPEMIDFFIDVEEKKTGEIHIGLGYSSANGILAELNYSENNIFGTGNIFSAGIQKGRQQFSLSGSYYQANIFDTILGGGLSLFYDDYKNEKLYFSNKDYGGGVNTSIPIYDDLYLKLRYLLKFNKIYDIKDIASETVKNQTKKTTSSSLMYQFIYDKRNFSEYPTEGYYASLSQDFTGLGGDKYFVSSDIGLKFYKTLFHFDEVKTNKNAVVFQFKNNFGIINPYNDYILRIEDRFFLSEFRGFKQISGVSPRDRGNSTISYYFIS
jgi:outer membrane protein insertion porin family